MVTTHFSGSRTPTRPTGSRTPPASPASPVRSSTARPRTSPAPSRGGPLRLQGWSVAGGGRSRPPSTRWRGVRGGRSPDSQHRILLFDIDQQKVLWDGSVTGGWTVAVAPDLEHVAAAGSRGRVFIWDRGQRVFTRDATSIVTAHSSNTSAVAFSPDSKFLATAGDDRRVVIRSVYTKKPVAVCQGHDGAVHDVAFSPRANASNPL